MSVSTEGNPFLEEGFAALARPTIGGCWVRQLDGSLVADPNEPAPPGLPDEPEPEPEP